MSSHSRARSDRSPRPALFEHDWCSGPRHPLTCSLRSVGDGAALAPLLKHLAEFTVCCTPGLAAGVVAKRAPLLCNTTKHQRRIGSTEAKRVRQHHIDLPLPRCVWHEIDGVLY